MQYSTLLMRPEHNETKAKTETRECKTKTENETKNYETEAETETSMINSIAHESKANRYDLLSNSYYTGYLK